MKKAIVLLLTVFSLALIAGPIKPSKKNVDITKSTIKWTGYKVTGKHFGSLKLKSGIITMDGDKLVGGNFVVDMASMSVDDLKGGGAEKLLGHLKSDDFFGTEKFGEANLVITKVTPKAMTGEYMVTADLTIKGIKQAVSFETKVASNMAGSTLKVDRTKYDIKYGSGSFFDNLGDKAISNDFDLEVNLVF